MGFFDHLPRTPSTMSVIYDILSFTLVLLFPVFSYPISAPSLFATTTRTRAFRLFSLSNTVVSSVAFPLFLLLLQVLCCTISQLHCPLHDLIFPASFAPLPTWTNAINALSLAECAGVPAPPHPSPLTRSIGASVSGDPQQPWLN